MEENGEEERIDIQYPSKGRLGVTVGNYGSHVVVDQKMPVERYSPSLQNPPIEDLTIISMQAVFKILSWKLDIILSQFSNLAHLKLCLDCLLIVREDAYIFCELGSN